MNVSDVQADWGRMGNASVLKTVFLVSFCFFVLQLFITTILIVVIIIIIKDASILILLSL